MSNSHAGGIASRPDQSQDILISPSVAGGGNQETKAERRFRSLYTTSCRGADAFQGLLLCGYQGEQRNRRMVLYAHMLRLIRRDFHRTAYG